MIPGMMFMGPGQLPRSMSNSRPTIRTVPPLDRFLRDEHIPPRPPPHVVPTLYHQDTRDYIAAKEGFYCFLGATKRAESPAHALGGSGDDDNDDMTNVLRLIFGLTVDVNPKVKFFNKMYIYKVKLQMCCGTEHVEVEPLVNQGGWEDCNTPDSEGYRRGDEFSGLLLSQTEMPRLHEQTIARLAFLRNDDGTYFTEGQLRSHWRETSFNCSPGMAACWGRDGHGPFPKCEFCNGVSPIPEVPEEEHPRGRGASSNHYYQCDKRCQALPGDTIYWKFADPLRVAYRWEPATDEELLERGYIDLELPVPRREQGRLATLCKSYREENSEPEESEDDEEEEKESGNKGDGSDKDDDNDDYTTDKPGRWKGKTSRPNKKKPRV